MGHDEGVRRVLFVALVALSACSGAGQIRTHSAPVNTAATGPTTVRTGSTTVTTGSTTVTTGSTTVTTGSTTVTTASEAVTTATAPPMPTPTVIAPAPALDAYLAAQSDVVTRTGLVAFGGTAVAVAARQLSGNDAEVDVLVWNGSAWALGSRLSLPPPTFPFADLPIQVSDVTGDGRPDFLVRVEAADNEPGVVASDDGGGWRLVPIVVSGAPDSVYAGRNPSFANSHLTTQYDDCTPNCAYGKMTTVVWQYDRMTKRFVSVGG